MRPGRAVEHSPPSSATVIEEYSYTSTHPVGHTGPVKGSLYLFTQKNTTRPETLSSRTDFPSHNCSSSFSASVQIFLSLPYSLLLVDCRRLSCYYRRLSTLLKSQYFCRIAGNVFYGLKEPGKFGVLYRVLWIIGTGQL